MYVVPDVSEHNPQLTNAYSRDAISLRVAFGDYWQDQKFLENTGIVAERWAAGTLDGGCVLYQPFIEPGSAQQHFDYLWSLIGPKVPDWLTGIMPDEESWTGAPYAQRGDKSAELNRYCGMNAQRMGSWKSVKAYANLPDFNALYSHRDSRLDVILAAYTGRLMPNVLPHQVAQQYTNGQAPAPKVGRHTLPTSSAPFGACDHSVYFGVSNAAQFRALWGRPARGKTVPSHKPPVAHDPKPTPAPTPKPAASPFNDYASPHGATVVRVYEDGGVTVRHNGKHATTLYSPNKGA